MSSHSFVAQSNLRAMYIYKLTNVIDNKCYIGQTTRTVEERVLEHFKYHLNGQSHCRKLSFAIKKYGPENFKIETIDTAISVDELNNKEVYWVKFYDSIGNGYNLAAGGDNRLISDETREKLSKAGKGRKLSPDQIKKMRESHIIPVFQYTSEGYFVREYPSAIDAFLVTRINNSEIGKCCKKKRRMAGGFQWTYKKSEKILRVKKKKPMPKRGEGNAPNAKRVALIDKDGNVIKIYKTAKMAALENECDHSSVVKSCKGKLKSVKNKLFIFV